MAAYTEPAWKGKACLAHPLFGTTAVHLAALWISWGEARLRGFLAGVKRNDVPLSTSNGESADFVATGQHDFALVDSDDAVNRIRQGKPLRMVFPDQGEGQPGCLLLPNAAVLIAGAPHLKNGKRLIDFLLSRETEAKLAAADCAQIPLRPGVAGPSGFPEIGAIRWMDVDYGAVARSLDAMRPVVKEWVGY